MNSGDQMVTEAYKHVGKPYVWATHGPDTFDCSGLVHYVVLQVTGTWIPPGTAAQQSMGSPVSPIPSALRPGDLLFYGDPPGGGLVTHVGIYVSPSVMIDAANENTGVRITDPFGSWYGERFLFARRLYPYDDSPTPPDPVPGIAAGDVVTGRVVLYAAADPAGAISTASETHTLCVTGLVVTGGGVDFLPVRVQDTGVDAFLMRGAARLDTKGGCADPGGGDPEPDPSEDPYPRTPAQWSPGDRIEVVDDPLNVRNAYPGGTVIGTYSTGEQMCVVDGPFAANGYSWVKVEGRLNGWLAGDFCTRIGIQACGGGTPPPDPDPDPPANWTHRVTGSALNLRSAPGGALLGTMPVGTRLRIISGPVAQGGYTWYEIEAEHVGTGWCVNGFDPI
jgi:hypothetical protein